MTPIKPQISFCQCNRPWIYYIIIISKAHYTSKKIFAVFIGVMGLTCLIKLIRFYIWYLLFLYHFSCIGVSFYSRVHCTYSRFSKWRPSAILNFKIFAIFVKNSNLRLLVRPCAKFGEDLMIRGRVIAYFRFLKWRSPSWIWFNVMSDHPRLVFDGPNILLNCMLIVFILCKISRFLYSAALAWNCLFTPLLEEFLGDITPKWIPILSQPPKGPFLGENTSYEP